MVEENYDKYHEGIRGWLLIWLMLAVGCLIYLVFSIKLDMLSGEIWRKATTPGEVYYHPLCKTFLIYEFVLQFANPIAMSTLIILCLAKRRIFPILAAGFYIANFVLVLVDVGISYRIMSDLGLHISSSWRTLLGSIFGLFVWCPYFLRSKRVNATFINQNT